MLDGKLAYVMLGSRNLDRAAAFYSDVLGLAMAARFGDFIFFQTGETALAVTGELAVPDGDSSTHECVFGVVSVAAANSALKDRVTFLNEPRAVNAENWAVNFRDPDGHLCSFYGPR